MEERTLSDRFLSSARLMHRYLFSRRQTEEPGFDSRRGQGRILDLLKRTSPISQKDLSYLLDIRQQSLGELLRKLEQSGYIIRTQLESDRRAMEVSITEQGRAAQIQRPDLSDVFRCLDESEQAAFGSILDKILVRLEELTKDTPEPPPRPGGHHGGPPPGGRRGHDGPPPPWGADPRIGSDHIREDRDHGHRRPGCRGWDDRRCGPPRCRRDHGPEDRHRFF